MPIENLLNNLIKPALNEGINSVTKSSEAGFNDIFEKSQRNLDISGGMKAKDAGNEEDYIKLMLNKSASRRAHAELEAKTKELVKKIAGYFGIAEGFLRLIMDGLHIKPEELLDADKRSAVLKKLEEYFGMDEEKKKEFEDFIAKTIDSINSGVF